MKQYLSIMSKKTKIKCAGVIALAFVGSFLASVWPVRLGELYTNISNGTINSIPKGVFAVLMFGMIYLSSELISILRRVMLDCIVSTHEEEVREHSIESLLKMPIAYYTGCPSGEKTAQLNHGVAGFSQLIKIVCNDVFATILTAVCTLVQVFLKAPGLMVVVMVLYLAITVIISIFQIRSQNGIRESIVNQKNSLDGQICQSIGNLELIRSMNAEEYEKLRLKPSVHSISTTEKKHHRYMGSFDGLKQFFKIVFQVLILVSSVVLIANEKMSAGSVITVCLLFQQLIKPVDDVYRFMDETASSVIKAKALLEVLKSKHDDVFDIKSTAEDVDGCEIIVDDVIVTTPERDRPLAWYDKIIIPCNKVVAIQGANGCGKTSLIRCLNRFYFHTQGKITVLGKSQEKYSQKDLAKILYYTPQNSSFFSGTIKENLLYGIDREVTARELEAALEKVHLAGYNHNDTVIRRNPSEALSIRIGEKAEELSGGMKQRLSLARAFLRTPKLFVFDEITANLDKDATSYVLDGIEEYAKSIGAGIVYISHDEQVVARCEKIITIKNKLAK